MREGRTQIHSLRALGLPLRLPHRHDVRQPYLSVTSSEVGVRSHHSCRELIGWAEGKQRAAAREAKKDVVDDQSRAFFTDEAEYRKIKQQQTTDYRDNKLRLERDRWETERKAQKLSEVVKAAGLLKQLYPGLTLEGAMALAREQFDRM